MLRKNVKLDRNIERSQTISNFINSALFKSSPYTLSHLKMTLKCLLQYCDEKMIDEATYRGESFSASDDIQFSNCNLVCKSLQRKALSSLPFYYMNEIAFTILVIESH